MATCAKQCWEPRIQLRGQGSSLTVASGAQPPSPRAALVVTAGDYNLREWSEATRGSAPAGSAAHTAASESAAPIPGLHPASWVPQWCPACGTGMQASFRSCLTTEGRRASVRGRRACGASWTLSQMRPPYGSGVEFNMWCVHDFV